MIKRRFQIFSLIFSLLSLFYMFLTYYGIFRYFRLKYINNDLKNLEKFATNYKNTFKDNKQKIVISFPESEPNFLYPFLNSIFDQSLRVDDIILTSIDSKKNNFHNYKDILNFHYILDKNIDIFSANVIFSILREPNADTKIIILNPNFIYGDDFIQSFVEESDLFPDSIIYTDQAFLIKPSFFNEDIINFQLQDNFISSIKKYSHSKFRHFPYFKNFKF